MLDAPVHELHVRAGVAEALGMVFAITLGDLQLRLGHVDADDLAALADELREHVAVAPGAAAEVEDAASLEQLGQDEATAVVAAADLVVDIGEQGADVGRQALGRAARVGSEIARVLEHFAVIMPYEIVHARLLPMGPGPASMRARARRRSPPSAVPTRTGNPEHKLQAPASASGAAPARGAPSPAAPVIGARPAGSP